MTMYEMWGAETMLFIVAFLESASRRTYGAAQPKIMATACATPIDFASNVR